MGYISGISAFAQLITGKLKTEVKFNVLIIISMSTQSAETGLQWGTISFWKVTKKKNQTLAYLHDG